MRETVFEYIKKKYKVSPEYPWAKYDSNAVFRHTDNKKWFALVMDVQRDRLGQHGDEYVDVINLKVDDMFFRDMLIQQDGVLPAYHMNKQHWITVLLDGTVPDDKVFDLIDMSFMATASKKKMEKIRGPKEWIIPANPKYYDIGYTCVANLVEVVMKDIKKDPFEEYIKNLPPTRREKGEAWSAAIGLQDVDGLKPSEYLYETAKKNIDGEITIDEVDELINTYYETKEGRAEHGTEEADKVSARIARLLSDKSFVFSPTQYISIHKELFKGIYSHAGKIRDYNITKKEWVLDGDTVAYGSALNLRETLDYDFSQERAFKYSGLTMAETIQHLALFVSRLWQIHIFGEGNTRTTAVFFIKYLRHLGFEADNDLFAEHSWYFRNALVRANYNNIKNGIYETTEYVEKFLRNLLQGEKNALHNREMHVSGKFVIKDNPINEPINDPIKPDEREAKIIELLRSEPGITRAKMAEALGCSESTVKRAIQAMVSKNMIRRIGPNKKGKWIIVE